MSPIPSPKGPPSLIKNKAFVYAESCTEVLLFTLKSCSRSLALLALQLLTGSLQLLSDRSEPDLVSYQFSVTLLISHAYLYSLSLPFSQLRASIAAVYSMPILEHCRWDIYDLIVIHTWDSQYFTFQLCEVLCCGEWYKPETTLGAGFLGPLLVWMISGHVS